MNERMSEEGKRFLCGGRCGDLHCPSDRGFTRKPNFIAHLQRVNPSWTGAQIQKVVEGGHKRRNQYLLRVTKNPEHWKPEDDEEAVVLSEVHPTLLGTNSKYEKRIMRKARALFNKHIERIQNFVVSRTAAALDDFIHTLPAGDPLNNAGILLHLVWRPLGTQWPLGEGGDMWETPINVPEEPEGDGDYKYVPLSEDEISDPLCALLSEAVETTRWTRVKIPKGKTRSQVKRPPIPTVPDLDDIEDDLSERCTSLVECFIHHRKGLLLLQSRGHRWLATRKHILETSKMCLIVGKELSSLQERFLREGTFLPPSPPRDGIEATEQDHDHHCKVDSIATKIEHFLRGDDVEAFNSLVKRIEGEGEEGQEEEEEEGE